MSNDRFRNLAEHEWTPEQKAAAQRVLDSPRKGLPGPFHALLRSPELTDRMRPLGDYVRYESSLAADMREFVILLAARFWSAQYEWHAHRNLALKAGLNPEIAAAIADGTRPPGMSDDQALIYDFMQELLYRKDINDATYDAAIARFGERTVLDVIATAGYFSFVSLILNAKRHPIPADAVALVPLSEPPI